MTTIVKACTVASLLFLLTQAEISLAEDITINHTQVDGITIEPGYLKIGDGATGSLTLNNNSVTVINNTLVGLSGGTGTLTLNNSYFETDNLAMGYIRSSGTITQNGGVANVRDMIVGAIGNSTTHSFGEYNLVTGTLNARRINIAYYGSDCTGTFNMNSGSSVTVEVDVVVGGTGYQSTFNQTGGDLVTPILTVGYYDSNGYYYMSGGTVTADTVNVMDKGFFQQSGQSQIIAQQLQFDEEMGSPIYHLNGGSIHVSGDITEQSSTSSQTTSLYIDGGTLTHDGAVSGLDYFKIGTSASGSYTVDGTSFQVENLEVGGTSSTGQLTITDASIYMEVSEKLTFNQNAQLSAVDGAAIHLTGSAFENFIQDPARMNDFLNLSLIFEGGSADLDPFEVGGRDEGSAESGWESNFAMDVLQLGGVDIGRVQLVDTYDNQLDWDGVEALYVDTLILGAGSYLDLNGINLYYRTLIDNGATIDYNGGNLFVLTEPIAIPEPATLILLSLSGLALIRRNNK